ncbi:hypothetical protein [Methylophaga sp. OBS4]|uniref:hypothetical protein n=1 Tax=Methylophaga sp. OBS4 TaxID=2991935 RepID=UPI00224EBC7E|nr:hypothetical protein [Methylophaga sp. OBS4]MCX4187050.1 hypothetical protein [Methylophaga sp. OBS4]
MGLPARAAYSYNQDKFGYHANVLMNKKTEGTQSTEIGDSLTYNLAVTYRLNGHTHHSHAGNPHTDTNWDAVLEFNGETRRKNKIGSHSEDNSGGTTILLVPGLRVSAGDFSGFVSIGLPFIENMNGKQTDIDMRILAGVAIALFPPSRACK